MTWEAELFALLDDLESQAQAAFAQDRAAELADRERAEYAAVPLAERLMASLDHEVVLDVVGVGRIAGAVVRVARGWLLLRAGGQEWIVCQDAIASVTGASVRAVPDIAWPVTARLGLGSALRRLADTGERCVLRRRDGAHHEGVIARVGKDFVELLSGEPRRQVLVALGGVAAIQSRA